MTLALAASLTIPEYGRAKVACSSETAARMAQDGHVSVVPMPNPGEFEIRARHKVGILRYGDLEIRITPKVSVSRLLYLATYGTIDDDAWKDYEALLDRTDDPFSALAHALAFHAEWALRPTPLQGYVTHEESEARIRGRIRFDRQMACRAGVLLPVELRYDEYELGIAENRVLKAALLVVARFGASGPLQSHLRHLIAQLDGVEPWINGLPVPDFTFGRLNERYRSALSLAKLILEEDSLEYPQRSRPGTAFLFNMNRVFEKYLESALRRSLEGIFGRVVGQHPSTLDYADTIGLLPDITWWRNEACSAVLDAKYKMVKSETYPNADAYQMLAYCTRLGLRRGYLVYADLDGSSTGVSVIRNADVEIVATWVDISGSIEQLQASIDSLVDRLVDQL